MEPCSRKTEPSLLPWTLPSSWALGQSLPLLASVSQLFHKVLFTELIQGAVCGLSRCPCYLEGRSGTEGVLGFPPFCRPREPTARHTHGACVDQMSPARILPHHLRCDPLRLGVNCIPNRQSCRVLG